VQQLNNQYLEKVRPPLHNLITGEDWRNDNPSLDTTPEPPNRNTWENPPKIPESATHTDKRGPDPGRKLAVKD